MLIRKLVYTVRILFLGITILTLLSNTSGISAIGAGSVSNSALSALGNYAIVFVSRRIPTNGSVYYPQTGSMPGVQPYSR